MRRPPRLALALLALALTAPPATSVAAASTRAGLPSGIRLAPPAGAPRALLLFLPAHEDPAYSVPPPGGDQPRPTTVLLDELAAQPQLSLGLVSATQGAYTAQQTDLDLSQGTRTAPTAYASGTPPLTLAANGDISGWAKAIHRAEGALQSVEPGVLASSVPGGVGYAGVTGETPVDAIVAADRGGHVAGVSIGGSSSLVPRTEALLGAHRLVVADLPPDAAGASALPSLLGARRPGDLVLVMQKPPPSGGPLLPIALAGGERAGGLASGTTHLHGLVAAIDVAPTVLRRIGVPLPAAMRGQRIVVSGARDPAAVRSLQSRLGDIESRRMPTLIMALVAWAVVCLLLGSLRGWRAARRRALRLGGLAFMWLPVMVLFTAALRPGSGTLESAIIAVGCFLLAAASDRLLAWPRGPLLPAVASVVAIALVLLSGSTLLATSLLGPDPSFGARFFGIGNELKSGLTVLVLVGVAAALGDRPASRSLVGRFVVVGVLLGVLLGSGRLGAGVGGVIIVASATAAAALVALPGRPSRRSVALGALSIPAALIALVALDLLTAGGRGHLSHDVLAVHSSGNVGDTVLRRYKLAYGAYVHGMPVAAIAAAVAVVFALRNRWLYDGVPGVAWRAALVGGIVGGIVGALTEDSGPLLLVVAVFMLACVTAYLRGDVRLDGASPPPPAGEAAAHGRYEAGAALAASER